MDPKSWGSNAWAFLHSSALHADLSQKTGEWRQFLEKFLKNVPCETCQDHADRQFKMKPQDEKSSAFEWTVHFHNSVNSRLGYPQWSLEQAKHAYSEKMCTGCGPETKVAMKDAMHKQVTQKSNENKSSKGLALILFFFILVLLGAWNYQDQLRSIVAKLQTGSTLNDALSSAM